MTDQQKQRIVAAIREFDPDEREFAALAAKIGGTRALAARAQEVGAAYERYRGSRDRLSAAIRDAGVRKVRLGRFLYWADGWETVRRLDLDDFEDVSAGNEG